MKGRMLNQKGANKTVLPKVKMYPASRNTISLSTRLNCPCRYTSGSSYAQQYYACNQANCCDEPLPKKTELRYTALMYGATQSLNGKHIHPAVLLSQQCDYLQHVIEHGKWLKMAVITRAFTWACFANAPRSLDYAVELQRFEKFELHTLIISLVYLQKVVREQSLDFDAFFNLFLICNILAYKLQEDYSTMNYHYAKQWDIPLRDLNAMEAYILRNLDYDVDIEFEDIVSIVEERMYYVKNILLT